MIQRNVSRYIQSCMENYFSVAIFGPRQCGKTTLVRGLYPDFSYANLEDMNTRAFARNDPDEFFTRFPEPAIIDEIQRVPELLSAVQVRTDRNGKTCARPVRAKDFTSRHLSRGMLIFQAKT